MFDACVMTLVRNGADYLEPCVLQVVDKVSSVKITIDSRSDDGTRNIAHRLAARYPQISVREHVVVEPLIDLVEARNSQLDFVETWGFIMDSDEFHWDILNYELSDVADAYALQCHAPWPARGKGHKASAKAVIGRIFRNTGVLRWNGTFGKEKLYRGEREVFADAVLLPHRYIHFTHLKHDDWRTELHQRRIADGRALYQLPDNIIRIIHNIHGEREKGLPAVRGWDFLQDLGYGAERTSELAGGEAGPGEERGDLPA